MPSDVYVHMSSGACRDQKGWSTGCLEWPDVGVGTKLGTSERVIPAPKGGDVTPALKTLIRKCCLLLMKDFR